MLVAGIHSVTQVLRESPALARELCIDASAKNPVLLELVKLAVAARVPVRRMASRELDRVARGLRHQGAALRIGQDQTDLPGFLKDLSEQAKRGMVLVALDQIQDPQNLGAIARAAACLGASGMIIPERRSAAVTPAVYQASAGAVSRIRLFTVVNLAQALGRLKEAGFWIYGADLGGDHSWSKTIAFPLVLVIGSEGSGLRPLVRGLCDGFLKIPLSEGGVESLNAACAASILLYELSRRKALPGA